MGRGLVEKIATVSPLPDTLGAVPRVPATPPSLLSAHAGVVVLFNRFAHSAGACRLSCGVDLSFGKLGVWGVGFSCDRSVVWQVCRYVLADWLVGCLVGQLVGWFLAGWLAGRLVSWLLGVGRSNTGKKCQGISSK